MGCSASTEAHPQEEYVSARIDRDLERARDEDNLKVKFLLLGPGESGVSTVLSDFSQYEYGAQGSKEEYIRMYGVLIRSNIITVMRELCTLLQTFSLEAPLAAEPVPEEDNGTEMTAKECYDVLVSHLTEGTADPGSLPQPDMDHDWVGVSALAEQAANRDARMFLQLWRYIKTLLDVRCLSS